MTLSEFEHIIKEVNDYTKSVYLHVKGEPLLHKDILLMLDICEKYNVRVNLTTNGTLLKHMVEKLNESKSLKKINISLHSEHHNPNYFEDIFSAVEKLNSSITVIYRMWTLNQNKLDEQSTEIVEKIKKQYKLDTDTVDKLHKDSNIKISSAVYVDKDNEFTWPEENDESHYGFCHGLKTQIAILSDGTVVPCCLDSEGVANLGNIYKESLENIQKKDRYQNLKKSFQDRKPIEKLCRSCTFKR